MATINFVPGTVVPSTWLNDVDAVVYDDIGGPGILPGATGASKVGFLQTGASAVARTVDAKLKNTPVCPEDFGAVGNGIATDYTAFVNALAASSALKLTPGKNYNLGNNALTLPSGCRIWSEGDRRSTKIFRTGTGGIFSTPENCQDIHIKNIYFTGTGNTQIGIFTPTTGVGAFRSYLINPTIEDCDFSYDLDYGYKGNLIFATVKNCTFGLFGDGTVPTVGLSPMKGIWNEYSFGTNYSNLNTYENNRFKCGNNTAAAVTIKSGINNKFIRNDWESCGMCVNMQDAYSDFEHCWTEQCVVTGGTGLFTVAPSSSVGTSTFRYCQLDYTAASHLFAYSSGVAQGFDIHKCVIVNSSGTPTIFYDTNTTLTTLPANGSIAFWDNTVVTSNAGDLTKNVNFRGGTNSKRIWGVCDTAGAGSHIYCSDAAATISRSGAGLVTIANTSMPLGTTTAKTMVIATMRSGTTARDVTASSSAATSFSFQATTDAGAGADGIIVYEVYGA